MLACICLSVDLFVSLSVRLHVWYMLSLILTPPHHFQASQRVSKSGCVRAEGIRISTGPGPRGPKVTRILAKAVGDGSGGKLDLNEGSKDKEKIEENLREVANNQLAYAELASAYLINPDARLEVKLILLLQILALSHDEVSHHHTRSCCSDSSHLISYHCTSSLITFLISFNLIFL